MLEVRGESRDERGMALLDVLLGMAIFAFIVSIAMTSFGQYRERAFAQGAASDATSAQVALEADFTDTQRYPAALDDATMTAERIHLSRGNTVVGYAADGDSFVFCIEHKSGDHKDAYAVVDSAAGGVTETGRGTGCDGITLDPGNTPVTATPTPTPTPTPPPPPPPILPVSDEFNSTGVLGSTEVGAQPWLFLNSTSSSWSRNSGYARTTTAAASNPMAAVDAKTADVAVTEGVRSDGDAIYFRVVDGSNWLRARVNSTSSTSGPWTLVVYYTDGTSYSNTYPTLTDCQNAYTSGTWSKPVQGWQCNGGTTTTTYYLVVDKAVGGTVTQLVSKSIGTALPAYIKVIAKGSSITTSYGADSSASSAASSVAETAYQSATLHGVGYAASATGVNSISIVDAP